MQKVVSQQCSFSATKIPLLGQGKLIIGIYFRHDISNQSKKTSYNICISLYQNLRVVFQYALKHKYLERGLSYLPYLLHQYPALSPPIIPPNAKTETVVAQRTEMLMVLRYFEEFVPCLLLQLALQKSLIIYKKGIIGTSNIFTYIKQNTIADCSNDPCTVVRIWYYLRNINPLFITKE